MNDLAAQVGPQEEEAAHGPPENIPQLIPLENFDIPHVNNHQDEQGEVILQDQEEMILEPPSA